jgi:hypothetical protein
VIAQVAFAFAEGDNPSVLVQVSVGESSDGPWAPAGDPDVTPTLTGPTYWVRFDITNTDGLGAVLTDLDISGFEPLSLDMCELEAPLPQDAETSCVIGGFPVQPGENEIEFDASGVGHRQGFKPDKWYQPPIPTSLDFDEAPNSFVLVFDTEEGTRLEGKADASEVEIDVGSVSGTIQLDCNGGTRFDGTPALEAYVIEKFSANGSSRERCSVIPTAELPFSRDDSDDVYFYFGEQGTTVTTTTISDTTTVTG